MKILASVFISIGLAASYGTTATKLNEPCEIVTSKEIYKDTSRVVLVNTWVYDTTATMLQGVIVDRVTLKPISGVSVSLQNGAIVFADTSNANGEFEIFKNLYQYDHNHWSLKIKHPDYHCIVLEDPLRSGGQFYRIKMKK